MGTETESGRDKASKQRARAVIGRRSGAVIVMGSDQ